MSAGVVIKIDHEFNSTGWAHVLEAFGITEIYELPGLGHPINNSIKIERLVDVANYHPTNLIVIQNRDGDFVQGVSDLTDLEHPEEAIYVFGGSLARLSQFDIGGAEIHESVFIPIGPVFPHQAAAIVFWDRLMKGTS